MLPILFKSSWLILFSYPLLMGIAWGFGYNYAKNAVEKYSLQKTNFNTFMIGLFSLSWIMSKALFLLVSNKQEFTKVALNSNFWLGGGFVFYGGVIGGLLFLLVFGAILKKYPVKETVYFLPALAFSHGIGRIGCFLAGCCYGTQCDLPWKIHLHGVFRHPVQLYEALSLLALGFVLHKLSNKKEPTKYLMNTYFGCYAVIRFVLEFFRGDKIRGLSFGLSTSQYISIAMLVGIAVLNIYLIKIKKNS